MATVPRYKSPRHSPSSMVSLVSMPFKVLSHPPIQLGILQRCLERAGFSARSHSLELAFMELLRRSADSTVAEPLTVEHYQRVATHDFAVHLGDWIFKVPSYTNT